MSPRYRAAPEQISARELRDFYTAVKNCLKLFVMTAPEGSDHEAVGLWWSNLGEVLKGFASAYENDPFFLEPNSEAIRFQYLGPSALTIILRSRDGADRETKSFCQISGIDWKASDIRKSTDNHIRRCIPIDAKARLRSLSSFQVHAHNNGPQPGATWMEHNLHEDTCKTIEEAYLDSVSTMREPSLCLSVDPELYSPGGENLTADESKLLAEWIRDHLIQSLWDELNKIKRSGWLPEDKVAKESEIEALVLERCPPPERLKAYKEGGPNFEIGRSSRSISEMRATQFCTELQTRTVEKRRASR